jgi:hypothetical protein
MLTYRLQGRSYRFPHGGSFEFPNRAVIEVKLGPPQVFGAGEGSCRIAPVSSSRRLVFGRDHGRIDVRPHTPITPFAVSIVSGKEPFAGWELIGDVLRCSFLCRDEGHLSGAIRAIYDLIVPLLNVGFADPPVVEHVRGKVGETEFEWGYQQASVPVRFVGEGELEGHVKLTFSSVQLFAGVENRRLAAALHYLHVASRLLVAGQTYWEFMAESVLNMTKALEILFGDMDQVREHLPQLGFSPEEIERDYIPIMVLRSHFDVAHPRTAVPSFDQLHTLYQYLWRAEHQMRVLLKRVLSRVSEGSYQVKDGGELRLDSTEQ